MRRTRTVNPSYHVGPPGAVRPAAAAQLQDRQQPRCSVHVEPAVAGHLGAEPEGDHGEHRRAGAQRLLGTGLRAAGGRGGAVLARPRVEAGERQPVAGRDRHDGADRRRPGAGRRGDPAADAGQRRGDAAQRRARAQAADRQRHGRRAVARDDRADRSADGGAAGRSTSKARCKSRSSSRTDLATTRKNLESDRRRRCRTWSTRRCRSSTSSAPTR